MRGTNSRTAEQVKVALKDAGERQLVCWYKSSDVHLIQPMIRNMPASDASTQRRGLARLAEFREAGITAVTVSRMERAGEVVRLARGLYQLPDAALDPQQSLAEAARLVPKGVICLPVPDFDALVAELRRKLAPHFASI